MRARDGDLRRRLACAVLRLAFDAEECRAIVEDVEELCDGPRGPAAGGAVLADDLLLSGGRVG